MTNEEIICQEAVASGYYTAEQVEALVEEGEMPAMHTFAIWKGQYNMAPRKGEHGWPCHLWLRKKKKLKANGKETEAEEKEVYYLAKSFLFHQSQVEQVVAKNA